MQLNLMEMTNLFLLLTFVVNMDPGLNNILV